MVARNVDTEKEYSTLQKAIDEATDGNTIQVISEISTLASAEATVVPEGLNVTIDVNGYKINENNALFLSNLGELTITNSIIMKQHHQLMMAVYIILVEVMLSIILEY